VRRQDLERRAIFNPFRKTKTAKRLIPTTQNAHELLKLRVARNGSPWVSILQRELKGRLILRNTSGACVKPTMQPLHAPEWLVRLGYTTPGTQSKSTALVQASSIVAAGTIKI
jgi:hypothetical protein